MEQLLQLAHEEGFLSRNLFESIDVWNSKDLIEAEEIKKRWQEYAEELHTQKKVLMTWITMMVWSLT